MNRKIFLFVFAFLVTTGIWAQKFQSGDLYYNITDETGQTVEVTYEVKSSTGNYSSLSGTLAIPATVTYNGTEYTVTAIGEYAFQYCASLTQATLPEGITAIGKYAFQHCSSLTQVTLPEGLAAMGEYTFANCSGLTEMTLPNSLGAIGDNTFFKCSALGQITIGNSVTAIGREAFYNCSALTQITLPEGLTSIGYKAFQGCSELTQINLPASLTTIDNWAFTECAALTQITIPDNVTAIGYGTFQGCEALAQVELGSGLTNIGEYAFYICTALTQVNIPDNVTHIESNAFKSCSALTQVTIGNGLTNLGDGAFANCNALTHFSVAEGNTAYSTENGILFNKNKTTLIQYPAGKTEATYTIPASVTRLGTEAFYGCSALACLHSLTTTPPTVGSNCFKDTSLELVYIPAGTTDAYTGAWGNGYTYVEEWELTVHVEIPGGLEAELNGHNPAQITKLTVTGTLNETDFSLINDNMTYLYSLDISGITNTTLPVGVFSVNNTLLQVVLPSQLTAIPDEAFLRCIIPDITIPEGVTSIGKDAFYKCNALTHITIPEGVTNIGNRAFANCSALTQVNWNATRCGDFTYSSAGMNYPPFNNSPVAELLLGDNVEYIPAYLCYGMNKLKQITIPASVTGVGNMAFAKCRELTRVNWNATRCGDFTLNNSDITNLPFFNSPVAEFVWGENVEYIPAYLCYEMDAITQVTFPAGITGMGEGAFAKCSALTQFLVEETNTAYCAEEGVLFNKDKTTLILYPLGKTETAYTVPASVTAIGNSAFSGCNALTQVTLPEGITDISDRSFAGCTALTQMLVPNSVTDMGEGAFAECTALDRITLSNNLTRIEAYTFNGCTALTQITIPDGVTNVGSSAFYHCTGLTQITIGSGVATIEELAFNGCTALTQITIPNSVTTIGNSAFGGCSSLTTVNMGSGLTAIGEWAFGFCSAIGQMTVKATLPPAVENYAFEYVSRDIPVYVPADGLAGYQTADTWKEFHLQALPITGVQTPSMPEGICLQNGTLHNPQQLPVSLYDMQGHLVYSGTETAITQPAGVYIIQCAGTSGKVVF